MSSVTGSIKEYRWEEEATKLWTIVSETWIVARPVPAEAGVRV